jgi:ribosomal protein S18 acetylase RimI-like enzyme
MNSSSAPPTAPASEPSRFTDAARLHARRFNKHPLASALRLLSADQRITHPDGGIALLTEVGHAVRTTVAFIATLAPAVAVMVTGIAAGQVALAIAAVVVATTSSLLLAPRCERQIRARRTYGTSPRTWVLSDVATEPHRGIGDALMRHVERCAERASVTVVLEVADTNEVARRLYLRHGFGVVEHRADRLLMRRVAEPA